jgi:DNA invertase Pin-like site-specific DNA recombinase
MLAELKRRSAGPHDWRCEAGMKTARATVAKKAQEMKKLANNGLSKSAIAKQLNVGRTSVRRLLAET